jgi:hypothetical protein
MRQNKLFQVDVEAARALANWKALFAELVSEQAKKLAEDENPACVITLAHYRQAAFIALESLKMTLQESDVRDDHKEAA